MLTVCPHASNLSTNKRDGYGMCYGCVTPRKSLSTSTQLSIMSPNLNSLNLHPACQSTGSPGTLKAQSKLQLTQSEFISVNSAHGDTV